MKKIAFTTWRELIPALRDVYFNNLSCVIYWELRDNFYLELSPDEGDWKLTLHRPTENWLYYIGSRPKTVYDDTSYLYWLMRVEEYIKAIDLLF